MSTRCRAALYLVLCLTGLSIGCGAGAEHNEGPPPAVRVGDEDVVVARRDTIIVGPTVSGELRAAKEATVRAEIGGSVAEVAFEAGQAVVKGALLARIEALPLRDAQRSGATAVRSAERQLELARREADRTEQLVGAGALAPRDFEQARTAVAQAEAQLADARARLATADEQLGKTVLRAPFDGVVSRRAVSIGDVVSPGTEMFTIIDPRSMRLEASVPSAELNALAVGAPVRFTVRGYDRPFVGRIERIGPAADPVTRQVPILVALNNPDGQLVAGLFAEGRVVAAEADGVVVPFNAVNTTGPEPWILTVEDGKAKRAAVQLGLRDPLTERVQILAGAMEGDLLLRGPAQAVPSGTPVQVLTERP